MRSHIRCREERYLVSTADTVLHTLADLRSGLVFTPERSDADGKMPREKCSGLHLDVVPVAPCDLGLETRGSIGYSPQVDIVIRQRMAMDQQEADDTWTLSDIDDSRFSSLTIGLRESRSGTPNIEDSLGS